MRKDTIEGSFLRLISSVLKNETPEPLPEGIHADEIMQLAVKQDMSVITYCGLNSISPKPESQRWDEWLEIVISKCMISTYQLTAIEILEQKLCSNGVRLLPLKGTILKALYPFPEYREMNDLDILYEGVNEDSLSKLMTELGYEVESLGETHHDVFDLRPCVEVELHRELGEAKDPYSKCLNDVMSQSVADPDIPNLLKMRPEDIYIHTIVHAARHFMASGLGVRPVCDVYLLNRAYSNIWDKEYISRKLDSVGLSLFSERLSLLGKVWMDDVASVFNETDENFFFSGGTFGDFDNEEKLFFAASGSNNGFLYLMERFFVSKAGKMKDIYPVLNRFPFLMPFMVLHRWMNAFFSDSDSIAKIREAVSPSAVKETADFRRVLTSFGLMTKTTKA